MKKAFYRKLANRKQSFFWSTQLVTKKDEFITFHNSKPLFKKILSVHTFLMYPLLEFAEH